MKNLIWFMVGAAVGAASGYYFAKNSLEKKSQEEVNEFIAAERERYSKKAEAEKESEETTEHFVTGLKSFHSQQAKENYFSAMTNYAAYSEKNSEKGSESPVEAEEEDDEDDGSLYPKEGDAKEPYSITPEEFANENPYFDKETLYYYQADDILTEDYGQIVQDPASLLGYDFESEIGKYEEDVGYFRNEKIGADYEVILEKGNFYSASLERGDTYSSGR